MRPERPLHCWLALLLKKNVRKGSFAVSRSMIKPLKVQHLRLAGLCLAAHLDPAAITLERKWFNQGFVMWTHRFSGLTPQSGLYCQEAEPCKHQVLCTPASWLKTCSFPLSLPELKYLPWREKSLSNRSSHPPLVPITAATAGGSLEPGEGRDYFPHNSSHLPVCPPQALTKD